MQPGDTYYDELVIRYDSGEPVNADATPTLALSRNGVDDAAVTFTITNPTTGLYKYSATIPLTYSLNDAIQIRVSATVNGVSTLDSIRTFRIADKMSIAEGGIGTNSMAPGAIYAEVVATDAREAIADAVADEALAGHATAGTLGAALSAVSTALSGITSLANWLRALARKSTPNSTALSEINSGGGSYDATTDSHEARQEQAAAIKVKTDTIGSATTTVANPTIVNQELTLFRGDDYSGVRVATVAIPATQTHTDWTGATMTMRVALKSDWEGNDYDPDTDGEAIGTVTHNITTAGGTVSIAYTATETGELTGTAGKLNYRYHIRATTTGGKAETVAVGALTVVRDA